MGLVWLIGMLVDRHAPKRTLPYFFVFCALALVPVIVFKHPLAVYAFAFFGTLAISGAIAALNPIMFGIPSSENRAGHYTAYNIVQNIAFAAGPIAIGLFCDAIPYRMVFGIIALFTLAMCPFTKVILSILSDKAEDYS